MVVTIDVGNTRVKYAVFEQGSVLDHFVSDAFEVVEKIHFILNKFTSVSHLVVSSVGIVDEKTFLVFENEVSVHFIKSTDQFPFVNNYGTPSTLGIDRMVLAAGATLRYPDQNRLVIDAGTCVTYDFVDHNQVYQGGAISPGLQLRYQSLHAFTSKLPLLATQVPVAVTGKSTAESMHTGVVQGLLFEIDGFIDYYKQINSDLVVILTGGDAAFVQPLLENEVVSDPHFLLSSLNSVFRFWNSEP